MAATAALRYLSGRLVTLERLQESRISGDSRAKQVGTPVEAAGENEEGLGNGATTLTLWACVRRRQGGSEVKMGKSKGR